MSMTEVVEESLKADARFRHLTVMPAQFGWRSAPEWANWLVSWKDGRKEFRKSYPWPSDGNFYIERRPRNELGCHRCGSCRSLDFKNCKNMRG